MNGSVVFVVVALIALSGHLASGRSLKASKVSEGPSTYRAGQFTHGAVSVFTANNNVAPQNISDQLPAGDFEYGYLTRNSLAWASLEINSDSPGYTVTGTSGSSNVTFTFIETFDISADGVSGGLVQLIGGGIGQDEFQLAVQPLSASQPLRLYVVAYAENYQNDGRNYRFGRYTAGLQQLSWSRVSTPAEEDEITTLTYTRIFDGEVAFIQSQDVIPRGQGALYITQGGIGAPNATFWSLSGYGEAVDRTFEVFGTTA